MPLRPSPEHDHTTAPRRLLDGDVRLWLLVLDAGNVELRPLPPAGRVSIGRAPTSGVCIAQTSVSRSHCELDLGAVIRVRDLGSANGTRVGGATLERGQWAEVLPGEAVEVGDVTVVVCRGAPPALAKTVRRAPTELVAPDVVVHDAGMKKLFELVARVAASELSVLVLGETGVGKELVAAAIHRASPRSAGPFLRLNCAALSPSLLESELFGHEKGAFTGAASSKPGLLEVAAGGTVLLDEIGEMPVALQVKLLRVLEERAVLRVGGLAPRPIDVRFVAATHRDLRRCVDEGTFREDFYYRLNGVALHVPPLRERRSEVAPLAQRFAQRGAGPAVVFAPDALARLEGYAWPGNVRELRNVVERAVVLAGDGPVRAEHLPPELLESAPAPRPGSSPLRSEIDALERRRILDALEACGGNQSRAAKQLGMPRSTLLLRLAEYGVLRAKR